jgi:hypothetical protein
MDPAAKESGATIGFFNMRIVEQHCVARFNQMTTLQYSRKGSESGQAVVSYYDRLLRSSKSTMV